MIISASRRTDIPAFYHEWFMNRIRAGECVVGNPFNPAQMVRVSLAPEDVDVIVFWTRDPRPLLPSLAELDARGYRYYFQFTLTGYPAALETGLPPRAELIEAFRALADHVGPQRIIWRYDPIVRSNLTDDAFHARNFAEIATALAGATQHAMVSLLDPYPKTTRRFRRLAADGVHIQEISEVDAALGALLRELAATGRAHGMDVRSCAEPFDLTPCGISPGKCVDDDYIQQVWGIEVTHVKDRAQRPTCGCVQSRDVGAYDTCPRGCVYCYATGNVARATARYARHDPLSPSLVAAETDE